MLMRIRKSLSNQSGFTLVELLAVMVIIGLLAAIAVPIYSSMTIKANTAKIAADLASIDSACTIAQANGVAVANINWALISVAPYFAAVPTPPSTGSYYNAGTVTAVLSTPAYTIATIGTAPNQVCRGEYNGLTSDLIHQ